MFAIAAAEVLTRFTEAESVEATVRSNEGSVTDSGSDDDTVPIIVRNLSILKTCKPQHPDSEELDNEVCIGDWASIHDLQSQRGQRLNGLIGEVVGVGERIGIQIY